MRKKRGEKTGVFIFFKKKTSFITIFYKILETPLKRCPQKCTFFWRFGTPAKAGVPKKSLKVFQNRCILNFSSKVLSKLGFCPFKPKIFEVKFPNTGQHPSFSHIQFYHLIHQHTKAHGNSGTSQVSQFQVYFFYSKVVKNGIFSHFG